jgi:hypothetical protein
MLAASISGAIICGAGIVIIAFLIEPAIGRQTALTCFRVAGRCRAIARLWAAVLSRLAAVKLILTAGDRIATRISHARNRRAGDRRVGATFAINADIVRAYVIIIAGGAVCAATYIRRTQIAARATSCGRIQVVRAFIDRAGKPILASKAWGRINANMNIRSACGGRPTGGYRAIITATTRKTNSIRRTGVIIPAGQQATDAAIAIRGEYAVAGAIITSHSRRARAGARFAASAVRNINRKRFTKVDACLDLAA